MAILLRLKDFAEKHQLAMFRRTPSEDCCFKRHHSPIASRHRPTTRPDPNGVGADLGRLWVGVRMHTGNFDAKANKGRH